MSRRTKLRGHRLRARLHILVAGVPGVDAALAGTLADRLAQAISSLRLRPGARSAGAVPAATPREISPAIASRPAFDPFAFSLLADAIAGEAVLRARLAGITDCGQLRELAQAQRLPVEAALLADPTAGPEALREGLARAALRRAGDRRAAAG
jgi:hypothetical protein